METEKNLVKIIKESGLEKAKCDILLEKFADYYEIASEWKKKADELVITDVSETDKMKLAREGRLFLKDKRVCIEKTREFLKEPSLREGQIIDKIAKELTKLIEPIEKTLAEKEKYVEIQEANRKAELKAKREAELLPYKEFVPMFVDISSMSDEDFTKLLNGSKLQLQAKVDAEAKAETERIENERKKELFNKRTLEIAAYKSIYDELVIKKTDESEYPIAIDSPLEQIGVNKIAPFEDFKITPLAIETTDQDYADLLFILKTKKEENDKKQQEIRLENERLKAEKEAKEALNKKRNEELRPYIIFIRDYDKMLNLNEHEYKLEFADIKRGAEEHWEYERIKQEEEQKRQTEIKNKVKNYTDRLVLDGYKEINPLLYSKNGFTVDKSQLEQLNEDEFIQRIDEVNKILSEREANEKERKRISDELKAKQDAEAAEKLRLEKEEAERKKAEKKAAKAPDKQRLTIWVDSMLIKGLPVENMSDESIKIAKEIFAKFEAFKKWAKEQIENM